MENRGVGRVIKLLSPASAGCVTVCARVCVMGRALYNKYKWALLRFYFVFVESVCARVFSPWLKYWRRRGGGGRPRPARPAPRRRRGAGPHATAQRPDTRAARVREPRVSPERGETRRAHAHSAQAGRRARAGMWCVRGETPDRDTGRDASRESRAPRGRDGPYGQIKKRDN